MSDSISRAVRSGASLIFLMTSSGTCCSAVCEGGLYDVADALRGRGGAFIAVAGATTSAICGRDGAGCGAGAAGKLALTGAAGGTDVTGTTGVGVGAACWTGEGVGAPGCAAGMELYGLAA